MDNKAKIGNGTDVAIEWVDVESSSLSKIAYDEPSGVFAVRFTNGGLYGYDGVPRDIFDQMPHVPSVGRYFNMMVKVGHSCVKFADEAELAEYIEARRSA